MPVIIGVKFRDAGKVYYFDPDGQEVRYHDHVIVETSRGMEYGTVVITPTFLEEDKIPGELKKIVRLATEEDDAHERDNREKEAEALKICKEKVRERELEMKLIGAEYTFDNSKIYFYFTAEGRIDFRELVKDLVSIFRTRIELRQIGVRDETKILGGIGSCGRPLCCHTWLNEFAPVSIKMAKDQNLSLNPTKISGCCGRLMCCLKNEADTYAELNKGLPNKGDYVTTPDGYHGDVSSVNILRQTVKVIVELENDEKEMQEFQVSEITFIPKAKKPKKDVKKNQKEDEEDVPQKKTEERAPRRNNEEMEEAPNFSEKKPPKEKKSSEDKKTPKDKKQQSEDKKQPREKKQQKDRKPRIKKVTPAEASEREKDKDKEKTASANTPADGAAPKNEKRRRRRRRNHPGSKGGKAPEKGTGNAETQG